MHIKGVKLTNFKRFADTTIAGVPKTARLVVLTGPNGSGKSAVFEAFNFWRRSNGGFGVARDADYFSKRPKRGSTTTHGVELEFHEDLPDKSEEIRKIFYIRSAYRNEPDFQSTAIQKQQTFGEQPGLEKLILTESRVRGNYERLVALTIEGVYDEANRKLLVEDLRERLIGKLKKAIAAVFGDVALDSPGDPLQDGTFFFTKGSSAGFHYKNLSGGEKAGFDLLIDFVVRATYHTDSIFCIDEPELHLGSRVQAKLLRTLVGLLPGGCQLWIATHSLGMMREALRIHDQDNGAVSFLDTYGMDFDKPQVLTPTQPSRDFWKQVLEVALDDVASLVGPETVFLCESERGFDADVYSTIFRKTKPNAEFISVGSAHQVVRGGGGASKAIGVVVPGTKVIRVIDRDDRTEPEIAQHRTNGVHVLCRRNIESYLLSDEILTKLCSEQGMPQLAGDILRARDSVVRKAGFPKDDFKKSAADVKAFAKKSLGMTQTGSDVDEFKRTVLAPLVTTDTAAYSELSGIFFD